MGSISCSSCPQPLRARLQALGGHKASPRNGPGHTEGLWPCRKELQDLEMALVPSGAPAVFPDTASCGHQARAGQFVLLGL